MKALSMGLILMTATTCALAEGREVVGCFTSGNINVKFVQLNRDGISLGYVKYQKSNNAIPLLIIDSFSEERKDGVPEEHTTKWAEYIEGKYNGEYTVTSRGARFYQFQYRSVKNVVTDFDDNSEAYSNDGRNCKW